MGVYGIEEYGRCGFNPQLARGTFTYYDNGYDEEETHERVMTMWQDGRLDPGCWLDSEEVFPLSDIREALEAVLARRMIKALVSLA